MSRKEIVVIQIKKAETIDDLNGILSLQAKNAKSSLSQSEMDKEGFVTLKHDLEILQLMNSFEPQIIAVDDGVVVGYALVLVPELRNQFEVLIPMFNKIDSIQYKSQLLSDSKYYVMGQVCIDKAYRGQGIFKKLYDQHCIEFKDSYDYCITEVSDKNKRSIRAHEKVGFRPVLSFSDEFDSWHIILLDLKSGSFTS